MLKLKPGPSLLSTGNGGAGNGGKSDEKKKESNQMHSVLFQLKRSPSKKKHEHRFPFKRNSQYTPSPLMISSTIKVVPPQLELDDKSDVKSDEKEIKEQKQTHPLMEDKEKEDKEKEEIKEPPQKQQKVTEEKEKKVVVNQKGFNFKLNLSKVKMNNINNKQEEKEKEKVNEEVKEIKEEIKKEIKENVNVNDNDNEEKEVITETSPQWKRFSILNSEIDETFILLKKTEAELSDITKMFDSNFNK